MKNDQSLTDRGWQQMAMLLDRELPQGRKRHRRGAWWLFATGIALILTGWGYHFLYSQDASKAPAPSQHELQHFPPVADGQEESTSSQRNAPPEQMEKSGKEEKPSTSLKLANEKEADEGKTEKLGKEERVEEVLADASSHATEAIEKPVSGVKKSSQSSASEKDKNIAQSADNKFTSEDAKIPLTQTDVQRHDIVLQSAEKATSPLTVHPAISTSQGSQKAEGDLVSNEVADHAEQAVEASSSSSSSSSMRVAYDISPLASQVQGIEGKAGTFLITTAPKLNKKRFGLEVIASVHGSTEGIVPYGIEGGVVASFTPMRKLRISTGVTYGYYSKDAVLGFSSSQDDESLPIVNQPPDPYYPSYDVMELYANELDYSEANQLAQEFGYIHVPFKIEYRALPRWAVSAGARFSKLVFVPGRYRLDDARFSSTGVDLQNSSSRNYLYDYDIVNKFDIAPTIGISWLAASRLSVELSYVHGIMNYINSKENRLDVVDRNDLHRTLAMGVRYRVL